MTMTLEEARAIRETFLSARRARYAATACTFRHACAVEDACRAEWDAVPADLAEAIRDEDMAQAVREWEAGR